MRNINFTLFGAREIHIDKHTRTQYGDISKRTAKWAEELLLKNAMPCTTFTMLFGKNLKIYQHVSGKGEDYA